MNEPNEEDNNTLKTQADPEVNDNKKKIFYMFSGSNTKYTLYIDEGSNSDAMSCDDFKRAICKMNKFTPWLAPRLKLYKMFSVDALTEYKRAETIPHGCTVLVSLCGDNSVSSALNCILPTLIPSKDSIILSDDRVKMSLYGIDTYLDPALLREKVLPKDCSVGTFSAETDCTVLSGLIAASIDEFHCKKEHYLARVVYALSLATQNPNNVELFMSFSNIFSQLVDILKCLITTYARFILPTDDADNSELLDETAASNTLGYCLQIFVNMTKVKYFWCLPKNELVNSVSSTATIHREGIPEIIAGLIELLDKKIHIGVNSPTILSVLILAIEAVGAISCGSLPVLTSLGSRKTFLDALVNIQRREIVFKNGGSARFGMLEFCVRQAAFNFLIVGSRGSPAFSKDASVSGSLDAIVDVLMWTTTMSYRGEADNDNVNSELDYEPISNSSSDLFDAKDYSPISELMSVLGDALAGGTTYSQWLMDGLLTKLFDENSSNDRVRDARAIYTKFPELQYRFIECLYMLIDPGKSSSKSNSAPAVNKDDDEKVIRESGTNMSDENMVSSKKKMSNKSSLIANEKFWDLLFSDYFMQIGSEKNDDGIIKLSTRKYFVCLRRKIYGFLVKLSEYKEVSLVTFKYLLRKSCESPCPDVRVICMEVIGTALASFSSKPDVIEDTEFIIDNMCVALSILSCSAALPSGVSINNNQFLKNTLVRYKSSRSVIVASIKSILDVKNTAINRQILANKDMIDELFKLLSDTEINEFALNEIMRLFYVDLEKDPLDPNVQSGLDILAKECVKHIEKFSGNSTEQEFELEISFLRDISCACQTKSRIQLLFVNSGIFFAILTLLTLQMPHFPDRKAKLLDECLSTLYYLFLSNPKAKSEFAASVGYESLKVTLYSFADYVDQQGVLDRLFEIVVESRSVWNESVPPTIQTPRMLLFICDLLPVLNHESIKYALSKILLLLNSPPNKSICCKNGVISALLEIIANSNLHSDDGSDENEEITGKDDDKNENGNDVVNNNEKNFTLKKSIPFNPEITPQIIDIIMILGSYMLSASELKRIIYLLSLSGPSKTRLPEFPYLVKALKKMPSQVDAPRSFFDFNGSTSKFTLPELDGEPFSKGFTFCIWIYFESPKLVEKIEYDPVIFSFSGERQLLELHVFNSTALALKMFGTSSPIKQQKEGSENYETVEFNSCQLPKNKWFLLTLVLLPGLISGEAKVYFDNELKEKAVIKYPKLPKLKKNELGRSYSAENKQKFVGNMGNIHLFGEPLSLNQIRSIYNAGPNYFGAFREQEFYVDGTYIHSKSFMLSYSARAQRNGNNIMNLTTIDGVDDSHILVGAAKTKDVETSIITTINDVISSAEGVFVLFPIILMLNNPPHPGYKSPYSDKDLLVFIIQLINHIVLGSPEFESMMINSHGYAIISHILKKIPSNCLSPKIVVELGKVYRVTALNEKFQTSLLNDLLLDFTLWVYASPETQYEIIRLLKEFVLSKQQRDRITAAFGFKVLRLFYWIHENDNLNEWELCAEPRFNTQTKEVIGTRPVPEKIREIRRGVYELIRIRFSGEDRVVPDDIDAFINFLSGCYDPEMVTEIIKSLCGTLYGGNAKSTAETFVMNNGLIVLIHAFDFPYVPLQVASIEMITRLNDIMLESNVRHARLDVVSVLIQQRLSLQDPIGMYVCNALFHMSRRPDPDKKYVFIAPSVLVLCLFPLLAIPGVALDVRNATLKDFSELLSSKSNTEKFMQCPGWEFPLAHLIEVHAEDCVEKKTMLMVSRLIASIVLSLSKCSIMKKNYARNIEVFFGMLRTAESRSSNKEFFINARTLYFDALSQFLVGLNNGTEYFSYALFFVFYAVNSLVYMEDSAPGHALHDANALVNFVVFFDKCSVTLSTNWNGYERWKYSSGTHFLRTRPGGFLAESVVIVLRILELLSIALCYSDKDDDIKKIQTLMDFSVKHLATFSDLYIPWLMGSFQSEYYYIFSRSIEIYEKFTKGTEAEKTLSKFISTLMEKVGEKKRYKRFLPGDTEGKFQLFATNWVSDPSIALVEPGWGYIINEIRKRAQSFETSVIASNYKNAGVYFKKLAGEDAPVAETTFHESILDIMSNGTDSVEEESNRRHDSEKVRLIDLAQKIRIQNAEGAHEWRNLIRALTAGNGPWGTAEAVPNWKLDKTENLSRMRLKMKRNYAFNSQDRLASMLLGPPGQTSSTLMPLSTMIPSMTASHLMTDINNSQRRSTLTASWFRGVNAAYVTNADNDDSNDEDSRDNFSDYDNNENDSSKDGTADTQTNKNLGKDVIYSSSCELIRPGRIINGQLSVVIQSGVHFLEGVEVNADKNAVKRRKKILWASNNIKEVHIRRYLLSYTALEIFFYDCTNVFINFPDKSSMTAAYNKITRGLKPPRLTLANNRSPKVILQNSGLTERWVAGELSNFDYLMSLNTIAGRTYNDLRQYPVFPWIIADYTSEFLDFSDPKTFRDLSKPVGALNPKRLNEFRGRYEQLKKMKEEMPDDDSITIPFMYGTHYSSPDTVFFYLIRTEPFANNFLRLQGRLDVPDRMFFDVSVAWDNCLSSTGDIKELIPEFFCFPEFLRNSNNYNFGKLQTGVPIGDVVLPPWAHGSPEEFIRINREALESEYVSAHLHEWIDLIFGYKQRGEEAVKADNIFCHFTYEGAVDLARITDERTRIVMRDQIANFGQTPSQLLTTPHPKRNFVPRSSVWLETVGSTMTPSSPTMKFLTSTAVTSGFCTKWSATVSLDGSPLVFATPVNNRIITVSSSRIICAHGFTGISDSAVQAARSSNTPPFALTINNKNSNGSSFKVFGTSFDENIMTKLGSKLFSATSSGKVLFSCGFWDGSFKAVNVDTREVILSVREHKNIVTCLKYTHQKGAFPEEGTLVTGSADTTVMTWNMTLVGESFNLSRQPLHVLYGHNDEITALDASTDFDIVVSGDKSGCLVVHTLRRGSFVWSTPISKAGSITLVKISPANGNIYVYSKECSMVTAFDINGHTLCTAEKCGDVMNDFCITNDGKTLLSCSALSPYIWIWDAFSLQVMQKIRLEAPAISVSVSNDDVLIIAGIKNGNLLIISPKDIKTKTKL